MIQFNVDYWHPRIQYSDLDQPDLNLDLVFYSDSNKLATILGHHLQSKLPTIDSTFDQFGLCNDFILHKQ